MGFFSNNEKEVLIAKKNYVNAVIKFVKNNIGTERTDRIEFENEIPRSNKSGYTIVGMKNTDNGVLFFERQPDGFSIDYVFVKDETLTLRELISIGNALELWSLTQGI